MALVINSEYEDDFDNNEKHINELEERCNKYKNEN